MGRNWVQPRSWDPSKRWEDWEQRLTGGTLGWSDEQLVIKIRAFINERLRTAPEGAVWRNYHGVGFILQGARDSVRVEARDDGEAQLHFGDYERPYCWLTVRPNGRASTHGESESREGAMARLAMVSNYQMGMTPETVYGWSEKGQVVTLLVGDDVVANEDATRLCPTGVAGFVLRGTQPRPELRMPRNAENKEVGEWLNRFWQYVKAGKIVRLNDRIRQLPGEMWSVCQGGQTAMLFDAVDNVRPELVARTPYDFWHPRERVVGELRLMKWEDHKKPMRPWVRH